MAVRRPLYINGSNNLQEMTDEQIENIVKLTCKRYGDDPSVTLSVYGPGIAVGNLNSMTDTRKIAGAASTSTAAAPPETTTAEPSTLDVFTYKRINQTVEAGLTIPADTNNTAYPVYYNDDGNLQAMSEQDMLDTFIYPAIDLLTLGLNDADISNQAGTYRLHTGTTLAGYTLVSPYPVFIDTRADTDAYTKEGIPEALDQPTTINTYYLLRVDPVAVTVTRPARVGVVNDDMYVQTMSSTELNAMLLGFVRYVAANTVGYRIRYEIETFTGTTITTGFPRGSAADTILTGDGNYQTLFVNVDDYRAQEFPNGLPINNSFYLLYIYKE